MLFAVHISSGVLANGWIVGGFALAAILLLPAMWKLREDEIPRIGVFTAAFFVASSVPIPVPLVVASVHLLLNGLVGVTLGRRAMLAVVVGLAMQSLLLNHGGMEALGVNACVVGIPAILAGWLFPLLKRLGLSARLRGFLLGAGAVAATALLNFFVLLVGGKEDWERLAQFVLLAHIPVALLEGVLLASLVSYLEKVKPELLAARSSTGCA
jgi:cobalt/nickel transport system permease protein